MIVRFPNGSSTYIAREIIIAVLVLLEHSLLK